jgi:hypothetical protein
LALIDLESSHCISVPTALALLVVLGHYSGHTLLSHDATARISCVGENAIFDTDSGGGCASSTSFVRTAAVEENIGDG